MNTTKALFRAGLDYLPKGQMLAPDVWRARHRALSYLLRAHVPGIFLFASIRGVGVAHAALEAAIIAGFAIAATDSRHRRRSSIVAASGLVTCSAMVVHVSGGLIEMHFHFFVVVGILSLYQDWLPFLVAIGYVVMHHGVLGLLAPTEVYNHPAAIAHPFRWALVHGGFVLAASAASVVAWKLNEEQSLKDALTGLANRSLFQDRVAHALARSQRRGRIAVLFMDLDGFKDVNDTLGHDAGDRLLIHVAGRLRASVRPGDTVARFGGDEFAVLLEDLEDDPAAATVADRMLASLGVPCRIDTREIVGRASIGIAMGRLESTVDELLMGADVAMYAAKVAGVGGYEVFESEMQRAVAERVKLESQLQGAIPRDELVVHYQPIVCLASGRIDGVEALVRWQHPDRGLLMPAEFLTIAEETGQIVGIGAWVLRTACRQAATWKLRFPNHALTMSVNLSPRQLARPDVVETVRGALEESGLDAADLVLELTEGTMIEDSPTTVDRLHALKSLGLQLAIDDFGTGYSSLSYLRKLPFDILKIDKLFVDGITDGPTEAAFAKAIIRLAQTVQLRTVAEGVEQPEQVEELRGLGCELAQGYLFARPVDFRGIEALMDAARVAETSVANKDVADEPLVAISA